MNATSRDQSEEIRACSEKCETSAEMNATSRDQSEEIRACSEKCETNAEMNAASRAQSQTELESCVDEMKIQGSENQEAEC